MGPILHQHTKMKTFIVISLALISCVAAQSFSGSGFAGSGSGSGSDRFFGAIINHLKDHFFGTDEESGSGSEDMPSSWEIPSSWDIQNPGTLMDMDLNQIFHHPGNGQNPGKFHPP